MCHESARWPHGPPPHRRLVGGGSLHSAEVSQRAFSAYAGPLILSSVSGYFLSRHALKPVDRMTRAALGIGIGNLSQRLPVPLAKDEIQHLAVAWNQLLARLEAAVSRLSQFSADASHDLRTSITVMLATAQLSLHRHRSEDEYRDALEKIVTECRTASTLLDALLSLAQSDNFVHEVAFKRINLCELVVNGCRRVEDLAESSGILLDWHLSGGDGLTSKAMNCCSNVCSEYFWTTQFVTRQSLARFELRSRVVADNAFVTVRDTGVGMSEDVRLHVFNRFYQADLRERKSNGRQRPGSLYRQMDRRCTRCRADGGKYSSGGLCLSDQIPGEGDESLPRADLLSQWRRRLKVAEIKLKSILRSSGISKNPLPDREYSLRVTQLNCPHSQYAPYAQFHHETKKPRRQHDCSVCIGGSIRAGQAVNPVAIKKPSLKHPRATQATTSTRRHCIWI